MFRSRSQESREEGRGINGSRTRITGRGRGREVDWPGPRSVGIGGWIIGLGIHESGRGDSDGSSACPSGFPTRLRLLGAEKVLDFVIRLHVNETEVLFDVAGPLEVIVTQWTLVLASLRGLVDMASQGRELGETLPAVADVGLVLVLGGMSFQLVVVWKRGGACGTFFIVPKAFSKLVSKKKKRLTWIQPWHAKPTQFQLVDLCQYELACSRHLTGPS